MQIWEQGYHSSWKKFNGPLFPNRVKLWPKTSDLVFVCPKVLEYWIWPYSEPWPRPISRILSDLKNNDPKVNFQSNFWKCWRQINICFSSIIWNMDSKLPISTHFNVLSARRQGFYASWKKLVINNFEGELLIAFISNMV